MRIVERHCWFPRNWMHFFLLTSTDDVETESFKLMHLLLLTVFYSAHLDVHSLPRKESRNREVFLELRIRRFVCIYVCIRRNLKKHRRDISLPAYLLCQEYLLSRFSTLPSVFHILFLFFIRHQEKTRYNTKAAYNSSICPGLPVERGTKCQRMKVRATVILLAI